MRPEIERVDDAGADNSQLSGGHVKGSGEIAPGRTSHDNSLQRQTHVWLMCHHG